MKIFRLFTIAAAALMMAACSEDVTQIINGGKKEFTATIAAPNKGGTRTAYNESGGDINVTWAVGDKIALVHNGVKDVVTVTAVDNTTGKATISGYITNATNGAAVALVYPAALVQTATSNNAYTPDPAVTGLMLTQSGNRDYIQENIDFREDNTPTLSVDGTGVTLSSDANLSSKIAILKLTLKDNAVSPAALAATKVKINKGTDILASTATIAATSEVYLAVPSVTTSSTLTIEATVGEDTYALTKEGVTVVSQTYYQSTVNLSKTIVLSTVTDATTIKDGYTVTGTLAANVQISIAAGATVTLDGVTITGENSSDYKWAGITCLGDATIILKDGTTNTVKGFYDVYPGILAAVDHTLIIQGGTAGTGSLTASSNGGGAGIGGGSQIACGNIEIQGGTVSASGGVYAAGIGSGFKKSCGTITISGGTVTATGGDDGAGIGSGVSSSCGNITISGGTVEATGKGKGAGIGSGYDGARCGDITITSGVTKVTATKGSGADNSIGEGYRGSCGTVTIGCTLDTDGNPVGGTGTTGAITQSPYEYSAPPALTLTNPAVGQVIGSDGKNYAAGSVPTGVTAVAMIAYVSGSNGLAIALADESGYMDWATAKSTCEAKTPAFTGGAWKLPSLDEWKNMLTYDGVYFYMNNNLQTALSTAGGNTLQNMMYYWSSTDYDSDNTKACDVEFQIVAENGEANFSNESKTYTSGMLVRAVLEF